MDKTRLYNFIDEELAGGEWWHQDGADVFKKACDTLLSRGMLEYEIRALLTDLYCAVSAEYGE
jgi:hypothetical protein